MPLVCPVCRSERVCHVVISKVILVCTCDDCLSQFTIRLHPPAPVLTTRTLTQPV